MVRRFFHPLLWFLAVLFVALPFAHATVRLVLGGPASYTIQPDGLSVQISVASLTNQSASTSGALRLELWAFATPYDGNSQSGYRLAQVDLQSLPGGSAFQNIVQTVAYTSPAGGVWQVSLQAEEQSGSSYAVLDYINITTPLSAPLKLAEFSWSPLQTVTLQNLVVDSGSVYWSIFEDGSVRAADKGHNGSRTLYSAAGARTIGSIVQDDAFLYFVRSESGIFSSLNKISKASGGFSVLLPYSVRTDVPNAARDALGIPPFGGRLYFNLQMDSPKDINLIGSYLGSISTQGGSLSKYDYVDGLGHDTPTSMCADYVNLYWFNVAEGNIWTLRQMPLVGGLITTIGTVAVNANFLSAPTAGAASGSLFWMEGPPANRTLKRRKVGGQVITVLSGISSTSYAIVNTNAYVSVGGRISSVPIDGGQVKPLLSLSDTGVADLIATDGQALYWTAINITATEVDVKSYTLVSGGISGTAPVITTQPVAQTVSPGATVMFTAAATGSPQPSLQWYKDGFLIPGATSGTLSIVNVQIADQGNYTCVATNANGAAASTPVALTILLTAEPTIPKPPLSQTVVNGSTVVLNITASNATSYQWKLNGSPIAGATNARLVISGATSANAGSYTCVATNSVGSTESAAATLAFTATSNPGRLINLSVLSNVQGTLTAGFVIGGAGTSGSENLLIRATGPALAPAPFNVPNVLSDPTLSVNQQSSSTVVASNSGWGTPSSNVALINTADSATGAFALTDSSSKDSALVKSLAPSPGGYTVQVKGASGDSGNALTEVYDATASYTVSTPRLVNLSCLTQVNAGGTLTAGFVIGGSTARTVLVRATGPALASAPFNVGGTMPDPQIKVQALGGSSVLASNAGWGGDSQITAADSAVGAFALTDATSKDSVVLLTLTPGPYTAQVTSASGAGGFALIEVYEVP